jgi:ribosomal subunit interface protein
MQQPLQITFNNVQKSDAITAKVRARAQKLERFFDSIVSCRVAIERPHRHHAAGNQYRVRVELTVPGDKLVANREPDEHHAYTDVYVAIRDAFDSVRRQLEEYARELREPVKAHELP